MKTSNLIEIRYLMESTHCEQKCNCILCEHLDFCTAFKNFYSELNKEINKREMINKQ